MRWLIPGIAVAALLAAIPATRPAAAQRKAGGVQVLHQMVETTDGAKRGTKLQAATAACPAGTTVTGGGARALASDSKDDVKLALLSSYPEGTSGVWKAEAVVTADLLATSRLRVHAWVYCLGA
jgi:hypothetical protein